MLLIQEIEILALLAVEFTAREMFILVTRIATAVPALRHRQKSLPAAYDKTHRIMMAAE